MYSIQARDVIWGGIFPLNLWGKIYKVSVLSDRDSDVKNVEIRHENTCGEIFGINRNNFCFFVKISKKGQWKYPPEKTEMTSLIQTQRVLYGDLLYFKNNDESTTKQ